MKPQRNNPSTGKENAEIQMTAEPFEEMKAEESNPSKTN